MKTFLFLVCGLSVSLMPLKALTSYAFDFGSGSTAPGYTHVDATTLFHHGKGYGFDLMAAPNAERFGRHALKGDACVSDQPFFFSVNVPEGDYKVTLLLGHAKKATETTIRAESRRLFFEHVRLKKGVFKEVSFTTNVRYVAIDSAEKVRIKPREVNKRNWDNRLTIELNGSLTSLCALKIERVDNAVTVFLCGNSTVVDQDNEPWCGWGQMIPRFFDASVSFANYAESGEAANSFISAKRLKKIETKIKAGDYLFVEFGHNDQKQKGENVGPWTSYTKHLTTYIELARSKGAIPVLVTSMHRRSFDAQGRITNTLLEYPDAVRKLAADWQVPLIDLNAMSKIMYEAWGPEASVKAFVHYPANTFPRQPQALADNTHFNAYGGYQLAKCVLEGIRVALPSLFAYVRPDYQPFNPSKPDKAEAFDLPSSPFVELEKPDGN